MAKPMPRCRLYLQAPPPVTADREAQLARALAAVSPACVLLTDNGEAMEKVPAIDRAIDTVQGAGAACLVENFEAAAELGADGVHISADPDLYAPARALLGASANIGVFCGQARHQAMQLAEAGADYVAFGPSATVEPSMHEAGEMLELVTWWSEIFVIPCVAWNVERVADAGAFADAGADFIAPPPTIWEDDEAIERLVELDRVISGNRRAA